MTTTDHPPPSTGERYSSATQSSNLRCEGEARGDVDMLIAAGLVKDGMGAALYRLQIEFDGVAADLRRLGQGASHSDRALVLMRVRSLAVAKREIAKHIEVRGWAGGLSPQIVFILINQVVGAFLLPKCQHCTGRKFNGGSHRGEKMELCRPCNGSGRVRDQIGRSEHERWFARALLAHMDRQMAEFDARVGRLRPRVREMKAELAAAVA